MEPRKLLCVMPHGVAPTLHEDIAAAGWVVDIAADLATARRSIRDNGHLLGLIAIDRIDDANCAALHEFLLVHNALEWVGIFSSSCLGSRACNEIILNHLFDFHTL